MARHRSRSSCRWARSWGRTPTRFTAPDTEAGRRTRTVVRARGNAYLARPVDAILIDGRPLSFDALVPLARGGDVALELPARAIAAVKKARAIVEKHVAAGDVVYGLT